MNLKKALEAETLEQEQEASISVTLIDVKNTMVDHAEHKQSTYEVN
jgi:hypothetical protein